MSDLISRQAAIDAVVEITYDQTALHHGWVNPYYVVNRLEYLPTAEKRGKWKADGTCPFCSYIQQFDDDNFCANCGARMEE